MTQSFPLEPIVNYLLDILKVKSGCLPDRAENSWPILFKLAKDQKIDLYLASFCLEQWSNQIPEDLQLHLKKTLLANKTRNTFLSIQIVELSKLFKKAEIPLMFIKGAAGIIKGLYPLELRYSSDLDVLVPTNFIEKSRDLLKSVGYIPEQDHNVPYHHHHIEPYCHVDNLSSVEIHIEPYDHSILDSPTIPIIWHDAENILFRGEEITVPSITDHAWILMRTSGSGIMFLPRLSETFEMSLILNNNYSIDFDLLMKRAEKDYIPNLVKGMAYACSRYLGIEPFVPIDDSLLTHWEHWSLDFQRKLLSNAHFKASRKRFGVLKFLPYPGIIPKIRLLKWLTRYEFLSDFPERGFSSELFLLIKLWRIVKNIFSYMIFLVEYLWFRVLSRFRQQC